MDLTLALARSAAGMTGGLALVKAEPGTSLIASYTLRSHATASGLVLEVHVDRPVGRLSRVRIDGVLAATADRHSCPPVLVRRDQGERAGRGALQRPPQSTW